MNQIKTILLERGYTDTQVDILEEKLSKIDLSLKQGLDNWLKNSHSETDYTISGVTLSDIKKKFKMTYPAALLTMDWVIREPEKAVESINKGIR